MLGFTMRQAVLIRYGAVIGLVGCSLVMLFRPDRGGQDLALEEIASFGGVRVMIVKEAASAPNLGGMIGARPPLEQSLRNYLPLLERELRVYPAEMIEKSGLNSVVLCSGLALNGQQVGGLPDFVRGRLYLEVIDDPNLRDDARHAIHHEHFHMIDFRGGWLNHPDPRWEGLNEKGTRYGGGGHLLLGDPTAGLPDESVAGFLNKYSLSGIEEDRAEVFAHMMANPKVLETRMAKDGILSAKYQEIRNRMKTFCLEMDDAFWVRVRDR